MNELQQKIIILKRNGDAKGEANTYDQIGDLYSRFSFNDSALVYFKKALKIGTNIDYKNYFPGITQKIANKYWDIGEYYQALESALLLKEYCEKENILEEREYLVNLLGIIYLRLKDYNVANEYFQHAIRISQRKKNYGLSGVIYSNIGDLYFEQGKYAEAIVNFEKGVALEVENKLYINAGRSFESMARVCLALGDTKRAEELLNNAIKYNQITADIVGFTRTYLAYGELFDYQKNYNMAIEYLTKAEVLAQKEGSKEYYMNICEQFSVVYQNINDLKNALYYQNKYVSFYKQIFNFQEYAEIKNIENDLRIEKHNNELNKYKIEKQRAILLLLIIVVFLSLLISLLFIVLYNRTLKSKKSLLAKNIEINEQKDNLNRINIELKEAKEKAEESDRLKTAFLHNISHEIRTPMNAIVGFSALLDEPDHTPEDQHSLVNTIRQSSDHLLSIITDIVNISNIEANIIKITERATNLNSVLKNLYDRSLPRVVENKILFRYETSLDDGMSFIQTDPARLEEILSNLIGNALKFTNQGEIAFGYVLKDQFIEFYVSDTGIGIPSDQHEKIFDRFYQVENAVSRKYEGTGLGLSICKSYVELLGGKIWLTSEPGRGSVFFFTIPYKPSMPFSGTGG